MKRDLSVIVGAISALLFSANSIAQNNHVAHCKGRNEVTPVESQGQCQAIFKARDGELEYKLIVANLENVFAAHIHCAPAGVNGPVGVTLYSGSPVTFTGILAQGPILAPNAGNACGWLDTVDILNAIGTGDAYVNVHTLSNPSGEVRGQIR